MSVATSIPCMRLPTSSSASSSSCTSSSTVLRLSHSSKPCMSFTTIRSSQTEGPIRRPVAPPTSPAPPLQPPLPPSASAPPAPPKPAVMVEDKSVVTLEFQRAKARELQEYFKQKKLEQASQGPVFGWVAKNEIGNGRWAMFGFAVGMLTEYATGSDFVDQVKLILSNLGIVDLD
ncbi:light-harvesting complex-like protein OHP2, chloroplastic [Silene latifolia]|uniref:light-harvesting complex-like protein OHP2, chloroplastic n=1 Tax=Silene latifolia TaxID=37657 RepID=UPI003D771EDC